MVFKGKFVEKSFDKDSLISFAIKGVWDAPVTATLTSLSYFAILTPTTAYLLAGFGNLTYLLVSAVQQLSKKVKDLETQISGSN